MLAPANIRYRGGHWSSSHTNRDLLQRIEFPTQRREK